MSANALLIFTAIGTYVLGLVSSYASRLWQLCFLTIRIPKSKLAKVYYYLATNQSYRFAFAESFPGTNSGNLPEVESSLILCDGMPLWLEISEKYLTAGWSAKEEILAITCLRFHKTKLYDLFKKAEKSKSESREFVEIFINQGSYFRQLNKLNRNKFIDSVCLPAQTLSQITKIVDEFDSGKRAKSGVLLYGPPGNGKTSIIKSIACKYDYNIYVPIFRPDMTNDNIINLFADIPPEEQAIIVLEDFDNLFNGRWVDLKEAKFTFDVFLNILDGLYVNLDNKVVFITANNISKVDKAIKKRPSRVDYVMQIDDPCLHTRLSILLKNGMDKETALRVAKLTDGKSAAIVAEVAKRQPDLDSLEKSVKEIIDSFVDDEPPPSISHESGDPVDDGIFKSLKVGEARVYNISQ